MPYYDECEYWDSFKTASDYPGCAIRAQTQPKAGEYIFCQISSWQSAHQYPTLRRIYTELRALLTRRFLSPQLPSHRSTFQVSSFGSADSVLGLSKAVYCSPFTDQTYTVALCPCDSIQFWRTY
ncbi:hypothetical protein PM082_001115 [Marasmius tenuissimus]|nr:hypothetical protein PM082_001115 [Marasmius tenuissimus]